MAKNRKAEDFSQRILELIEDAKSLANLSRESGVSESSLRKYKNGTEPGLSQLLALAEARSVHLTWLATGEGPKLLDESDIVSVPIYKKGKKTTDTYPFQADFLNARNLKPNHSRVVYAEGKGIPGDVLLIDTASKTVTDGCVYLLNLQQQFVARRILISGPNTVRLSDDTAGSKPMELKSSELDVYGRVIWAGREL